MNRIYHASAFILVSFTMMISILPACTPAKPSRYQIITEGGIISLMDMKTLDVYYNYGADWHRVSPVGVDTVIDELPR